jgi:hypothetical protein
MISTITVCRGETDRLAAVIPQLVAWSDDVHVVETAPDAGPTRAVCADMAHVHHRPRALPADFDTARAEALEHVSHDWVMVVDTDERVPDTLVQAVHQSLAAWERDGVEAVWIPRRNWVLTRPLAASSAWPDYQLRLFRRRSMRLQPVLHNYAIPPEQTARLAADHTLAIEHRNFVSTHQFLEKVNDYTTREAMQAGAVRPAKLRHAVLGGAREFGARWVKMRGYRDGPEGLHYCLLMGLYRYLVLAKGWEGRHDDAG